jgi:hypothetical protein
MRAISKSFSKRNKIPYASIPTRRGSIAGGSVVVHYPERYGEVLDCFYEMTDMIASGNGVSIDSAMATVLKDEGWKVLPTHKKLIKKMLAE